MPAPYSVTYFSANLKCFTMNNATLFDAESDSLVIGDQRPQVVLVIDFG